MRSTSTVTLKHPARIGGIYYQAGTIVKVAKLEDVRKRFPNINYNENSKAVALNFRDDVISFVHCDQIKR